MGNGRRSGWRWWRDCIVAGDLAGGGEEEGGVRDLRWEVFLNVWVWIIKKRILGTPPFVGLMITNGVTD